MRIFKNCIEMVKEMDRELYQSGITVPVKHYQNKELKEEDQNTKELIGVTFTISKPVKTRNEMIEFLFKDDSERILKYCEQEHSDRVSFQNLNPGNSYKIRKDMWQKFMVEGTKFDYTYSERLYNQYEKVINELKRDKHTRQAVFQIFNYDIDNKKIGGNTRIPCSMDYQFLIRNDRLHLIYHMRSNDYFGHFGIDIYLATRFMEFIIEQLKDTYDLKIGSLTYFSGSLHAYKWDISKWVIF